MLALTLPAAAAPTIGEAAQSLLPGVYELQEWHTPGGVLKPPQIYGRVILVDGTVATVLRNEAQPDKRTTSVTVGRYQLDGRHFAYTRLHQRLLVHGDAERSHRFPQNSVGGLALVQNRSNPGRGAGPLRRRPGIRIHPLGDDVRGEGGDPATGLSTYLEDVTLALRALTEATVGRIFTLLKGAAFGSLT